ncbi:MAG: hypothetical protein HDR04_13455 [Lachnospiraceae bacterium]|nr:hypothetical protein [Lachnospiraceae bacterium]
MRLIDIIKKALDRPSNDSHQIVIREGASLSQRRNLNLADWVYSFDNTLKCSDGSSLPIDNVNALITGDSLYKNEIITRQIVAGLLKGYTPLVISANGKNGLLYNVLRTIFDESSINYISEEYSSKRYSPFSGLTIDEVTDFFYGLVCDFQTDQINGMLVRNYVSVCVSVFFANGKAVSDLLTGQLDHMRLLHEINRLYDTGEITESVRQQYTYAANSAQSVSVPVLSVIQDYIYKFRKISNSKPTIRIRSVNTPQIRILGTNGNSQINISPHNTNVNDKGICLSDIMAGKCLYIEIKNDVTRNLRNSLNEQCFQWYLSRTLRLEIESRIELKNRPLMVIVDNLSDTMVNCFWGIINLPNSVRIINYDDFYSKLSATQDYRQQLIGMAETMYFFSVINEESAAWASRTFGTHMVPKVVVTNQPYREWTDVFFPPKSYAHDEIEKPWFSGHEIQHLGNMGIVYSRRHKIFKPYYRENGKTYVDQNYKRQRVNFCLFEFR